MTVIENDRTQLRFLTCRVARVRFCVSFTVEMHLDCLTVEILKYLEW